MNTRLVPVADLTIFQRRCMLDLMHLHYENVDDAAFGRDLMAKSHVLLIEEAEKLVGFTTLVAFSADVAPGAPVQVVYSGDTIVHHQFRGSTQLFRGWFRALESLGLFGAGVRSLWLLLAGGVRTYCLLPSFWLEYFPAPHARHPALSETAARLASARFGLRFNPSAGVVHPENAYSLRVLSNEQRSDPHAAFFARCNPGYTRGDELVCLTWLSPDNLTPLGHRMSGR